MVYERLRKGHLAERPRGESGFGFDVIFIPQGQTKTYAQPAQDFKNKNSARYLALVKLKRFLENKK